MVQLEHQTVCIKVEKKLICSRQYFGTSLKSVLIIGTLCEILVPMTISTFKQINFKQKN